MDKFFEIVLPEKSIKEVLTVFEAATGLYAELIDENGNTIFSAGSRPEFCNCFSCLMSPENTCNSEHLRGGNEAFRFGDSYFFSCHAGLYHLAFPIVHNNKLAATVVVGPFLLEKPDYLHMIHLQKRYHFQTKDLLFLSDSLQNIKMISAETANQYSRLMYYLHMGISAGNKEILALNNKKLLQQSRINEAIQAYKKGGQKSYDDYPFDKENQLITCIRSGDNEQSKSILNELLAYIFLRESNDVRKIRVRIIELCSILSRAAIAEGSDPYLIMSTSDRLIQSFIDSDDIFEISYNFTENIDLYADSLFVSTEKKNKVIKKAAEYIAGHFAENITLQDVASNVHVNPSYLSTLFKQVSGSTFKEHLNKVRVKEAEFLLKNTNYPIMDIAVSCGFNDQSYFTKVFKSITGTTPKQYR